MKSMIVAADPGVQKAVVTISAVSGVASGWSAAKEIALEIFGVPMPVVLACATAAFGALSFHSGMTYCRTLWAGTVWTMLGSWCAQFSLSLIGGWVGVEIPIAALAGAGIAAAGAGALFVTKSNVNKARAAVGRWIDNIGKQP
jgi:hypothetical protein